jgi:hypothetical protein
LGLNPQYPETLSHGCDWLDWFSPIIIFIDFNIYHLQASLGARISSLSFYPWSFSLAGCLVPFIQLGLKLLFSSLFLVF